MSRYPKSIGNRPLHPRTLMMGYGYDPALSEGAIKCPIFQTSTFVFRNAAEGKRAFEIAYGQREPELGEIPELIYSRINNPDLEILENRLAIWEGADEALAFSSGMAAISTTLFAFVRPGTVVLYSNPLYGGSDHLISKVFPLFGIRSIPLEGPGHKDEILAAMDKAKAYGPVSAIFVETPANPTNMLHALDEIAETLRALFPDETARPPLIVDNTFMGPLWQQPLRHGADLSVYSLTKYVGGHSDIVAGGCLGHAKRIATVRGMRTILGTICDPHTGWLLLRSMETLDLRMQRSGENAARVAGFLRNHPRVKDVGYLGYLAEGSDQRAIFDRQCLGAGATFSCTIAGGEAEAYRFLDALCIFKLAVSLGGTESLASHPATMTHTDVDPATKEAFGITPGLVRLSIGIEYPDDLEADLAQALAQI